MRGQPTKYKPEYIEAIGEYLLTVGRENMELPTREGFAHRIGVNGDTLVEWEKHWPDFSAAIKAGIDENQKKQLMNDGLYGGKEVNSTMAIFLLKVNHDMIEKTAVDINANVTSIAPNISLDIVPDK